MHHISSPFPSLTSSSSSSKRPPRPASDTSTSPPSSRTTSPPASPTSSYHHHNHNHHQNQNQNHLFNLSFHPHHNNHNNRHQTQNQPTSNPKHDRNYPTPDSPPQCGISILPCAVLRGRSSMMLLRRRPSAVDLALTEERSRCDGDAIERQGLDLMEPRPVDMNMNMNLGGGGGGSAAGASDRRASLGLGGDARAGVQQPRCVMGGIFEVMEGRA